MTRICRVIGMVAPPIAVTTVFLAGVVTPGYDPVSRTVSRLAAPGMPAAIAIDVAICLVGSTCIALALVLARGARTGRGALAVSGVALIFSAIFHLDPASFESTALHRAAAGVAMLGLTVAPLALSRNYGRISLAVGVAELGVLAAGLVLVPTSFSAWGAWERCLLALPLAWMVLLSARLRPGVLTMLSTEEIASARAASLSSTGT